MKNTIIIFVAVLFFGVNYKMVAGTWTALDVPGAVQTEVYGISGSNIVGNYRPASEPVNYYGFFYNNGNWTQFNPWLYGISGSNIVGLVPNTLYGALYDWKTWTDLNVPGAIATYPSGISGDKIVGYYQQNASSSGEFSFLKDGTNYITNLSMPNALSTVAIGIDGSNIVGAYFGCNVVYGFLYNMNSASCTTFSAPWVTNDPLPFGIWCETMAYGISGTNIVGVYYNTTDYISHGFLLSGTKNWTSLDAPGAKNGTSVRGISGDKIVGYYVDANTNHHGFIYTISAPAVPAVASKINISNKTVTVSFNGVPGNIYGVESTTNFVHWSPVAPVVVSSNSVGVYSEHVSGSNRYYRLVSD